MLDEFQAQLIFPTSAVPAAGPLPPGAERLQVKSADGHHLLHGVHVPPSEPEDAGKTLILGFGGNAWNGEDVASYLHEVFPEADVVTFHYRGYAPSAGAPSAEALIADAPLAYDLAVERVKPRRTIGVGFSIGSGIAATLAAQRKLAGLILVTPFDSLKAVAESIYPWLPIGPLFRHEIDAAGALDQIEIPVAIVAAERDEIVAPERTEALRARVPAVVFDRTIERAGHNDIYARSDFHAAMREALAAVTR
ncbi:MAG: alpha/beta hydrolase [Sphingomicrobium sp.]